MKYSINKRTFLLPTVPADIKDLSEARRLFFNFSQVLDSIVSSLQQSDPFTTANDVEITVTTSGLILVSPNGTRFRVTVSNAGSLVVTSI